MKTITLKKCAYIFHWSNNNYFWGTNKDYERKCATRKELFKLYGKNAARTFNYTKDSAGRYVVELGGLEITLNPEMILYVDDNTENANIINNRLYKSLAGLENNFRYESYYDGDETIRSNKYCSLYLENYMNPASLTYYRLHFNGYHITFIISNNKIYTPDSLKELSYKEIYDRINAKSDKARNEIKMMLDYLTA